MFSEKCLVIAEIGQAHDGSLGAAHAYIDAVAKTGADVVKFQTHIASAESTKEEPWRVRFSEQDSSRFDYWKRMEFSKEQWHSLAEHAKMKGLHFLSSPFSAQAVDMLGNLSMPFWKVASGEMYNPELLNAIWETGKPVVYSSGMSGYEDLDRIVEQTRKREIPFAICQCSSAYPAPAEAWGLGLIQLLRSRYGCPIGLSDHSGAIYASLAAVALGANLVEVHVTFSKECFGPDVSSSVTMDELGKIVEGVRLIDTSLRATNDKDELVAATKNLKKMFGRSLALKQDLAAGQVVVEKHLTLKKPATGIPYESLGQVVGRRLRRDKSSEHLLAWDDLE